jgi:hypothetical protein
MTTSLLACTVAPNLTPYVVTVDYNRSLPEMIAAGRYDRADREITAEHFPLTGEGKVEMALILVHFNRNILVDDALTVMDQLGLRSAVLPELLALGEMHPAVQKEFPIIAFGSIWEERTCLYRVPYLYRALAKRKLNLGYDGGYRRENFRFAAVLK